MKKFVSIVLCVMCVALASIGLVGCGEEAKLLDLTQCEIGTELSVYPTCTFSYEIEDGFIVEISNITAKLTEKREINEGDVLNERFSPCVVTVTAQGKTSSDKAGTVLTLGLAQSIPNPGLVAGEASVQQDGTIRWSFEDDGMCFYSSLIFRMVSE